MTRRHYAHTNEMPGSPLWDAMFSPAARAEQVAKWARIREAESWARSRPWSKMNGGFWARYRQRLRKAGASDGLVEDYIDELQDEKRNA